MVRKIVDSDKKHLGITISLPPESIKLMDTDRGQKSRSAFINYLIEKQDGYNIR